MININNFLFHLLPHDTSLNSLKWRANLNCMYKFIFYQKKKKKNKKKINHKVPLANECS